jgi:nucleotide-binding universal stress UspA family protein
MFRNYYIKALEDYRKARRKAAIDELLARISGTPQKSDLLSYEEVRQQLQAIEKSPQRLEEIPLDAIVGSVGRYHDFTRKYLPKSAIDEKRWARVMATSQGLSGLPPIEVYQIGKVYFVKDGNHRVSVARQMGNKTIQAFVTAVETKVDLAPDVTPDDLIIKSELVNFLDKTNLDKLKPGADLTATKPGAYPTLLEHIAVHRYFMGVEQQREIPFQEAAVHWFEEIFQPTVNIINKRGLLDDFPDRTVTDLYLWAADHRAALADQLGWDIGTEAAISDLSEKHGQRSQSILNKLRQLISWLMPDSLESGPPPGTWRNKLARMTVLQHLFNDLIIALDDSDNAWHALEMGIQLSHLENSRLHGLHIHPEQEGDDPGDHSELQEPFYQRCQQAGIPQFDFKIVAGEVGKILCDQARFADLILLPLNHPPGDKAITRLSSGLITIIRNCPVPILSIPSPPTGIHSILLAFDGSIKSWEAMYIAAYFGSQYGSKLAVLTSSDGLTNPEEIQREAQEYLSQFPITTDFLLREDPVATAIADLKHEREIDLVMIGGYGGNVLRDVVLGSKVDEVLREIQLPILICR